MKSHGESTKPVPPMRRRLMVSGCLFLLVGGWLFGVPVAVLTKQLFCTWHNCFDNASARCWLRLPTLFVLAALASSFVQSLAGV